MRVLRTWGLGVGAAVALCVTATVAVGQSPPPPNYPECTKKPTSADIDGAKGAHNAATQFYERAEYDKAIRYWNDALGFDCTASGLLKNIANAYEKLGDKNATITTLEAYMKRTGPDQVLEQKVKNLKASMQAPPSGTGTVPTATSGPTSTAAPTVTATATTVAPPEGPRPYGNTPWFVVGGGGALALVGAILVPVGLSNVSAAEKICGVDHNAKTCTQDAAAQGNAGRAENIAGGVLLAAGLAAAGGGLVWQILLNKPKPIAAPGPTGQPPRTSVWITPVAGPRQSGVVVGGSF